MEQHMQHSKFAAFIVLLLFAFSLSAIAQPMEGRRKFDRKGKWSDRGNRHELMMEKLNLTDAQKDKIEDLRSAHQKKMLDLRQATERTQLDLSDLMRSGKPEKSKVLDMEKKLSDLRAQKSTERTSHLFDIASILDEKQQEIWWDFHSQKGKRNAGWSQGRGFRGYCRR